MITSKNLTLMITAIPSESTFESHFYHIDLSRAHSNYIPGVAFRRYGYISG